MGINPTLSDLRGPGTSKLEWRYFGHNEIDRNELQIPKNSQKGTGTKMAEKLLLFFFKLQEKKSHFSPVLNPETFRCPRPLPQIFECYKIHKTWEKQVKICYLVRVCPIYKSLIVVVYASMHILLLTYNWHT